jgi:hypothetical protein
LGPLDERGRRAAEQVYRANVFFASKKGVS